MILSYHYSADYDPPAPIIPITLISLTVELHFREALHVTGKVK